MKTISLLRREEYRRISKLTIDGKILDVGGSYKSGYHELIKGTHTFTVANIDASYGADILFDAEGAWPCDDASYDAVLLINVLEHLYDYQAALAEAHRTLAPEGIIVGVVPFLYNVHGSPSDYYRYTRYSLERLLSDAGFTTVIVEELGTGAFSVVHHVIGGVIRPRIINSLIEPLFTGTDKLLGKIRPNNLMSAKTFPLGYYFEARR